MTIRRSAKKHSVSMKQRFERTLFLLLIFWLPFPMGSRAAEPIFIGLSVPLNGQYSEYGNAIQRGVDLAIEGINAEDGIKGRPMEVIVGDSRGLPRIAQRVARRLASNQRIVAVMGNVTDSCALAAQPIFRRAGIVQLSLAASHPSFATGSPYSFGLAGTVEQESKFMARMAVEQLGKKRIAVMYVTNDWGISAKQSFIKEVKRLGADIVAVEGFSEYGGAKAYLDGSDFFKPILAKVRTAIPDLLYLISRYRNGVMILQQRQAMAWRGADVMGPFPWYFPQVLEDACATAENLYTCGLFLPTALSTERKQFVKDYKALYFLPPDPYAALAYDATNILAKIIRKSGDDRGVIRDALAKLEDFPGVTGLISFTPEREVQRDYILITVKQNEFHLYSPE